MSKIETRIYYDENWNGEGEHFVFETRREGEDWGLDSAFPLVSYENGELVCGKGDLINYTALTKIREYKKLGVKIYFTSK